MCVHLFILLASAHISWVCSSFHLFIEHLKIFWNNIINDVSNYHNLSLQFMTEMKETAFIMQNVSSKYVFSTVFFSLSNTQEIVYFCIKENTAEDWNLIFFWYFSCFLLMAMNLQELDCCGWAWKGDIFLWWVGNCMELLWTPSFCQSVKTSNPLLTTLTANFSYSLVL